MIRPEHYANLNRLVSQVPAFVWLAGTDLVYTSVLGSQFLADGDVRGRTVLEIPGDNNPDHPFVRACERATKGESATCDFPFRGRLYRACLEPQVGDDGSVVGIVGIAYDVTDRVRVEELLMNEFRFDTLTSLPNKTVFHERLRLVLAETEETGTSFGILIIDLDHFKAVNEALGLKIGDLFLQMVAERIRGCVSEESFLARFGGDQFAIITPSDHEGRAVTELCREIVNEFARPILVNAREIFSTVSIGVTIVPNDGLDLETVVGNAGTALHDAKDLGGNGFRRYDAKRRDHASDRFAIETDLRRTVGADDGVVADLGNEGFILHYQPLMSAVDETIVAAEALIRWNHPLRKLVPPDAFIPLAEQTGLIVKIGKWVLRTAFMQLKAWDNAGIRVNRMAINISGRQFHHSNLVETVEELLRETGVDAHRIELELTETVVMRDVEATIHTLERLKALGVHLSIDDFGTGYSSLAYLKRFPIDTLKIDRSFTRDASNTAADAAIVGTIISLGHNLGKRVVAEGVETRGQIDFLRELKCDELQGFYFSRPLPAEGFEKFYRDPKHGLQAPVTHVRRRVSKFSD
jgi:diguanylate cyclase (GGDEF)-like protein